MHHKAASITSLRPLPRNNAGMATSNISEAVLKAMKTV
jgi:hypothetical protein